MRRFVPYLAEEAIERDVAALFAEFERSRGITLAPPICIEDIIEKHLKLGIEFDDIHNLFGVPRKYQTKADILGALFFDEARIVIDESLDPEEDPIKEGRFRFTLAHESGHWRLHRHIFTKNQVQKEFFGGPGGPSVVCRSSQARERVEWQADFYASCVLMPRKMVFAIWNELFPDRKQRVLQPCTPVNHPFIEVQPMRASVGAFDISDTPDQALERFCEPLAERFLVSPVAMRIRLEKLGLLLRAVPHQRFLASRLIPLLRKLSSVN